MPVLPVRKCEIAMLVLASLTTLFVFTVEIAPASTVLPMKACQLIMTKDVQSVLGGGYAPQEMLHNEVQSICGYNKQGGDTAVIVHLSRTIYDAPQYLKMEQEGMKQSGGQVKVTPVSGLGDGAFYFVAPSQNGPAFQLHFGKGPFVVIVDVETNHQPNVDAAMKLAKIAYPRIP